jgi:predicted secreted protein
MQLVSAVRVVLPGPEAGAGTAWEVVSNNTRVLEQTGPLKAIPSSGAPGSAATTIASFYSLKPGRSVLRFVLVRPNEAESVPLAECNLTVHVND